MPDIFLLSRKKAFKSNICQYFSCYDWFVSVYFQSLIKAKETCLPVRGSHGPEKEKEKWRNVNWNWHFPRDLAVFKVPGKDCVWLTVFCNFGRLNAFKLLNVYVFMLCLHLRIMIKDRFSLPKFYSPPLVIETPMWITLKTFVLMKESVDHFTTRGSDRIQSIRSCRYIVRWPYRAIYN